MTYRSSPSASPITANRNLDRGAAVKPDHNEKPHMDDKPQSTPHPKYYFADGTVTFLIQDTLFRVHRYFLERESEIFRDLLSKNPYSGAQDDTIIPLAECTCTDFESLLWVFYNECYDDYSALKETWKSIMALSVLFKMPTVLSLAKKNLLSYLLDDPIEQVQLQVKYDIEPEWALDGYMALARRKEPLSLDEAKRVGLECMVIIQSAKFILSVSGKHPKTDKVVRRCIMKVYGGQGQEAMHGLGPVDATESADLQAAVSIPDPAKPQEITPQVGLVKAPGPIPQIAPAEVRKAIPQEVLADVQDSTPQTIPVEGTEYTLQKNSARVSEPAPAIVKSPESAPVRVPEPPLAKVPAPVPAKILEPAPAKATELSFSKVPMPESPPAQAPSPIIPVKAPEPPASRGKASEPIPTAASTKMSEPALAREQEPTYGGSAALAARLSKLRAGKK